jgi:hypothetical protein
MEAENLTPYPAILPRTVLDGDNMGASMIARVTYDIEGDALRPAVEQVWPARPEPWKSPLGPLGPDEPLRKDGVDLFVLGDAHAPAGKPVRQLDVSVELGAFRCAARVFGVRVWRRKEGGGWAATEPEEFVTAKLDAATAYGGRAVIDEREAPYPLNPDGIGFYPNEDSAEDRPLPLFEDADALVTHPLDRPDPIGFGACAFPHPLRLRESVEIQDGRARDLRLRMFNQAHPKMIAPSAAPGDEVRLTGFTPGAPIAFRIPPTPLRVVLQLGARRIERTPAIDEIGVDVAKSQVFLGYRYPFRYYVTRYERRTCTLVLAEV